MKKYLILLLIFGCLVICSLGVVFAQNNYEITPRTGVLWDNLMVTHFPSVSYVNVDSEVKQFGVSIECSEPAPICLEIMSPYNVTVYDFYDKIPDQDMGIVIDTKEFGTGRYTVRVFKGYTAPLDYKLILKGPMEL